VSGVRLPIGSVCLRGARREGPSPGMLKIERAGSRTSG
jgi:hypothetical protein